MDMTDRLRPAPVVVIDWKWALPILLTLIGTIAVQSYNLGRWKAETDAQWPRVTRLEIWRGERDTAREQALQRIARMETTLEQVLKLVERLDAERRSR